MDQFRCSGGGNGGAPGMTKEGIMLVMLWPLALDLNGLIVNFFLFNG